MKKSLLQIAVSIIVAIAVADYAIIQLFQDDKSFVEVESEYDQEELSESEKSESKYGLHYIGELPSIQDFDSHTFFFLNSESKRHNFSEKADEKLFILYHQLKLHC